MKKVGHPTALQKDEEEAIVRHLLVCSKWGMLLSSMDIRCIVKEYLDEKGRNVENFNNNLPGPEWCNLFVNRYHEKLSMRICQNIKTARANVGKETISNYFEYLKKAVEGVKKSNITNYDETNFSDNPGTKKLIFKRGVKYPY